MELHITTNHGYTMLSTLPVSVRLQVSGDKPKYHLYPCTSALCKGIIRLYSMLAE